jgi:hypothetical protein
MEIKLEYNKKDIILNEVEFKDLPENLSDSFLLRLLKILN